MDEAVAFVKENAGKHFDPEVGAHFLLRLPEILAIVERNADPQS